MRLVLKNIARLLMVENEPVDRVAGSDMATLINPIQLVTDALGIEIVTE